MRLWRTSGLLSPRHQEHRNGVSVSASDRTYSIDLGASGHGTVKVVESGVERDISNQINGVEFSAHVGSVTVITLYSPGGVRVELAEGKKRLVHGSCADCQGHDAETHEWS